MVRVRHYLKVLGLSATTLLAIIFRRPLAPVILTYHSFDTQGWRYGVSPGDLEEQLTYLVKNRTVVPLEKMVQFANGEHVLEQDAVAITVDDGYLDTYEVLFPVAQKYKIPFTLFLTTDLGPQEKLGNLPRPTWEQLREMAASPLVTLGVHGHSHTNFPDVLKVGTQEQEIVASKTLIEQKCETTVEYAAYPAGRCNREVFEYMKEAGFTACLSTFMATVKPGVDLFTLPRIPVDRLTSFLLFKLRLSSGLDWYLHITRRSK